MTLTDSGCSGAPLKPPRCSAAGGALKEMQINRGIRGDHAVDPRGTHFLREHDDLFAAQVRRYLDQQRHTLAKALLQKHALLEQRAENAPQPVARLQFAQTLGVGRGDIHRNVAGKGVDLAQAGNIVILGFSMGVSKFLPMLMPRIPG